MITIPINCNVIGIIIIIVYRTRIYLFFSNIFVLNINCRLYQIIYNVEKQNFLLTIDIPNIIICFCFCIFYLRCFRPYKVICSIQIKEGRRKGMGLCYYFNLILSHPY